MKKPLGVLVFATIKLTLFAQERVQKKDSVLSYYIMKKHGKLTEVSNGRKNFVTKDITLINETAMYRNGPINVYSGRVRHLHERQYMTLDGRILRLKDMPSSGMLRLLPGKKKLTAQTRLVWEDTDGRDGSSVYIDRDVFA